jgi:hypothetical protein
MRPGGLSSDDLRKFFKNARMLQVGCLAAAKNLRNGPSTPEIFSTPITSSLSRMVQIPAHWEQCYRSWSTIELMS